MMAELAHSTTYLARRERLHTYFDKTAVEAWAKLTSEAPVSGIRATVRAGRDAMRATLLSQLPADMTGQTLLDAGCGTGALAVAAAKRGADVTAVDLSPTLVDLAGKRLPSDLGGGSITFAHGDMLSPELGSFDHVVAMDSLIHYPVADIMAALEVLAKRTHISIHFTYAPKTPLLALMHAVGQFFPRSDRSPAIEPVSTNQLHKCLLESAALSAWTIGEDTSISSGFYKSTAKELRRL